MGTQTAGHQLRRAERGSLFFFAVVAAAYGVLVAVGSAARIVAVLVAETIEVQMSAVFAVPDSAVTGPARLVSGSFDSALLVLADVSTPARLLLAASALALGLAQVLIAGTIVFASIGLVRGRPFGRSMTWLLATASITLIAGGLLGYALGIAAQFTIAAELNPDPVGSVFPFAGGFDLTIVFVGVVLGVVAAAFEIGERMQRDTDGLV
ncbi:hypothetical protein [Microterricola pindariensis]|uniref:DUF2975 domain-containing protein n=1 Tax=Microterricola pindariensis TaxID=478010 RepID=A0ABX5AYY7_9MICO|nr:hypothetical protein [Microterricola pindariensis]PPL19856.1 hypothetical protein GY24_03610 [Microterricola pindariensis]